MNYLYALTPVLRIISEGKLFRLVFAWMFRIFSGVVVLGILWASWTMWSSTGRGMPISYFLSFLLVQVALFAIAYVIFNILMFRSNDIMNLPHTKMYSITPIVVVLCKTAGEVAFATFALFGFSVGLAGFFSGARIPIPIYLPFFSQFVGAQGGGMMISGILFGFMLLVFFYFIGEMIGVLVDIAMGVNRGR